MEVDLVIVSIVQKRCWIDKRPVFISGADMSHLYFIQELGNPIIIHF
ncbi:uncharacterized protein METZ01_LOCUS135754 [marine metagenome]|uniref:Uncharacterized protein n=1 Tax=marine metagenome TaxID=408172 RepID=A0A381Z124_9ZZZZ